MSDTGFQVKINFIDRSSCVIPYSTEKEAREYVRDIFDFRYMRVKLSETLLKYYIIEAIRDIEISGPFTSAWPSK